MKVFIHHLYEYSKGLRRLILHTTDAENETAVRERLDRKGIAYIVQRPSDRKINVFFGDGECIEVLKTFPNLRLDTLTIDQDFILGAMLGYDIKIQCRRYLDFCRNRDLSRPVCISA